MVKVGIVGLQGGVAEHYYMVRLAAERSGVNAEPVIVKRPEHLDGVDALILPGGESTTIGAVARRVGLLDRLRDTILSGTPVLGTCAGAILMAKRVVGGTKRGQPLLSVMDVEVHRNYFGRQRESFELDVNVDFLDSPFRGVFIRAPAFTAFWGNARPAATVKIDGAEVHVAAVEDAMIATSFHPELTGDTRIHEYLLRLAKR
jgi:5'-phosphate synthase pdxT subunit